jgi:GT2 family glycosyltransferase
VNGPTPPSDAPLDDASEWHRIAEERRVQLERLQQQRLYVVAATVLARIRRIRWVLLRTVEPVRALLLRAARSLMAAPRRASAARREAQLRTGLALLARPAPDHGGPDADEVTAVIVSAGQPQRLDVLLAALARVGVDAIVVDNAGVPATAEVIGRHPHARGIRLSTPQSYAAANEAAIATVTTPWMLLLNDDVAPLEDTWFSRLCAAATGQVVAVGAQLVHGRRGWWGGEAIDLTVQHAGIGFDLAGPLPTPNHLDRGTDPRPRAAVRVVPAATAACLLVDVAAHRAVGGLHLGFDYGMEDVDLCLRLAQHGEIVVALDAVLLHEEGATRLRGDRRARTQRQQANRRLLDARHGPRLQRAIASTALTERQAGDAEDASGRRETPAPQLNIAVAGPVPDALARLAAADGRLRLTAPRSEVWTPILIVTDLGAVEDRDLEAGIVIGWFASHDAAEGGPDTHDAADALARSAVLDRLDRVVIDDGTDVPHDLQQDGRASAFVAALTVHHPTLPVQLGGVADAEGWRELLHGLVATDRWSIRIGAPAGRAGERWGDAPVADALRRELRSLGRIARVSPRDGWGVGVDAAADVTVHLKGRGVAPVAAAQTNIVWILSHPSELAPGELDAADLVLAASVPLAAHLSGRTTTPVEVLHQAADARVMVAGPRDEEVASRVLFVGNTRSVARPAVLGAIEAGLELTLVGAGWERYVDPRLVLRSSVPNSDLGRWYRSADVVLNDHWDEMRRWGLASNRVFDVLACGGCIVSDELPGLTELLDGAVPTFVATDELAATVTGLLDDPQRRAALVERGRRLVLAEHTWQRRAAQLVELVTGTDVRSAASGLQ